MRIIIIYVRGQIERELKKLERNAKTCLCMKMLFQHVSFLLCGKPIHHFKLIYLLDCHLGNSS